MNNDLKIAEMNEMRPIVEIAKQLELQDDELECYGRYKAKVSSSLFERVKDQKDGKLILVTAINPTPAGEGKSTTTIGLVDGLQKLGKKVVGALREPSLGPVFGLKGGATGGGYSQVVPMSDINLHFTGDMHAITAANNLIAAMLDNSIYQGNELNIDPTSVVHQRCLDMNDRSLRDITIAQGKKINGIERKDSFCITVATELMAVLCLAKDLKDFERRVGEMVIAYTYDKKPVTVDDIHATGAVSVVMKDALKPNLVQSLEHAPFLIHGGPFANIAHGCNSILATSLALKLGDYVVTEAGFGADLGAEKFLDIKCRTGNLHPSAVVLVATIRALKMHGGLSKEELDQSNPQAMLKGIANMEKHIETIEAFHLPYVVSLNRFEKDSVEELDAFASYCKEHNIPFELSEGYAKGSDGMLALSNHVIKLCEQENDFAMLYDEKESIPNKILKVAQTVYGAKSVEYSEEALEKIALFEQANVDKVPVCIAKTPLSLSDDKTLKNRPRDFVLHVKDLRLSKGAGFLVVYTGTVLTMPGLPKKPAANDMGLEDDGTIYGLF